MDQAQLLALGKDLLLLISPLVAQGAIQKIGENTTDRVRQLTQRAWGVLQPRLAGDAEAESALTLYRAKPEKESRRDELAELIVQRFANDAQAIAELQEVVRDLRVAMGAPATQRTHNQTISDSAQVGVAIAGDVHGGITHTQQSGGVNFGSGTKIEKMGDVIAGDKVAGDKVAGDKVQGDKILNYGAPKPADTGPEHIHQLIDRHTRRLRVLETQAAATGYNVRPEVQTEIEDIQIELARLQALLDP